MISNVVCCSCDIINCPYSKATNLMLLTCRCCEHNRLKRRWYKIISWHAAVVLICLLLWKWLIDPKRWHRPKNDGTRGVFFCYQRVRGMICLIADEVYSLATSIRHRSTSYDYYLASCRWEHLPLDLEDSPNRADKERLSDCTAPLRRRSSLDGAVTAPFIWPRRRAGAVLHCTAPLFSVVCRGLPWFAVLFSSPAHVHSMSEKCQVGAGRGATTTHACPRVIRPDILKGELNNKEDY